MKSTVGTYVHIDGEIQRYELIEGLSWKDLTYTYLETTPRSIAAIVRLYRANIIPKNPSMYGTMVFSHVPASISNIPFERQTEAGYLYDNQALTRYHFTRLLAKGDLTVRDGKISCTDSTVQHFFESLQKAGYLSVVEGKRESITYVPISGTFGFLSESCQATTAVNSHFFLMDPTDIDSPYDSLATSYGFAVEKGNILQPPLHDRESLVVDSTGRARIINPTLTSLTVSVSGYDMKDGKNGISFYSRPEWRRTPEKDGTDLIVVNRKLVALSEGGGIKIPMAGFVIHSDAILDITDQKVTYTIDEDIQFAVQVGPAAVKVGVVQETLCCPFYTGEGTPYPSTVYPLPYETARAARTGIATINDKPVILWLEGASKNGHVPHKESSGSSLLETAIIAGKLGITDMVNMDGGGSAQINHSYGRNLLIADRDVQSNEEKERPVPLGLMIRKS